MELLLCPPEITYCTSRKLSESKITRRLNIYRLYQPYRLKAENRAQIANDISGDTTVDMPSDINQYID